MEKIFGTLSGKEILAGVEKHPLLETEPNVLLETEPNVLCLQKQLF